MLPFARRARVWPGAPYPLGATFDGRGVNFALFSANAEKVALCLYDARGERELERVVLPECTAHVPSRPASRPVSPPPPDERDNARGMPKCRVGDPAFTWGEDRHLRTPWH